MVPASGPRPAGGPRVRLAAPAARPRAECRAGPRVSKGLSVLEWTGNVVPQGTLVKGVKLGWRQLWLAFMRELAPQDRTGGYQRPSYASAGFIGRDRRVPPGPRRAAPPAPAHPGADGP